MTPSRRTVLLSLPVALAASACAGGGRRGGREADAEWRFAAALDAAEDATDALVLRMDAFERQAAADEEAIDFATGRGRLGAQPRFTPAPAGAADAAGRVIDAAFAALGDYGEVLAQAASGRRVTDAEGPNGEGFARVAEAGLEELRRTGGGAVPEAQRQAGLRGIAALADLPGTLARGGQRPTEAAMLAEARPHVAAIAALLRAAIGTGPGQGARGAINARQNALDASHARLLAAVRADNRVGPTERYNVFRSVAEARDDDPDEDAFEALVALVDAMEQAHAALGTEGAEADAKVAAFEAAVLRLRAYNEASRRG